MLEAASLTMHATHSCLVDAVFIVGGVGLPLSRVGYRCWYVSSRGRGSQFWSDLRHVVRARVGLGGSGDARGTFDDLRERARGPREAWASGDDWAEIAYGYAREDDEAINNSSAADEATDTSIMVDDIAVSNSPDRSSEETRGGDGRRRDTVDADQVRAMTVEAMERIIFGPVGDLDRSLDVLEDLGRTTRGTDGQGANTRDAGTGAGSVTTHTTATATGVGAGVATGTETVLLARDVDRARSSRHSSSSSASRSHWPGPVQLPEWINEERAPSHFKCPITLCVMREPAVTPAGITYERSALMQWLDHQHVEPSTKRRLKRSHVVPNLTLRAMIEDWLQHERDVRSGKSGGGGGVDGSSGGRIDNHGGLPPGRGGGAAGGSGRAEGGASAHVRGAQGTGGDGRVLRGAAVGGVPRESKSGGGRRDDQSRGSGRRGCRGGYVRRGVGFGFHVARAYPHASKRARHGGAPHRAGVGVWPRAPRGAVESIRR